MNENVLSLPEPQAPLPFHHVVSEVPRGAHRGGTRTPEKRRESVRYPRVSVDISRADQVRGRAVPAGKATAACQGGARRGSIRRRGVGANGAFRQARRVLRVAAVVAELVGLRMRGEYGEVQRPRLARPDGPRRVVFVPVMDSQSNTRE